MIRRAFLAFPLPEEVQEQIALACTPFRALPMRFVPPSSLHITLVFLGDTEEKKLGNLIERLRTDLTALPEPDVEFTEIALAPPSAGRAPKRCTMLWIFGETTEELRNMHAKLRASARACEYSTESRPFTVHATLARFRARDASRIRHTLKSPIPLTATFRPSAVSVLHRAAGEGSARYETFDEVPFGQ